MSRRKASITQADISRAVRAAKQAGASEVEVRIDEKGASVFVRLQPSSTAEQPPALEPRGGIVL